MISKFQIRIIDLFHTNIGLIAIFEFPTHLNPKIGMVLHDDKNATWKIVQLGIQSKLRYSEYSQYLDEKKNVWQGVLQPQTENESLTKSDILYLNLES
jgi:hypothetical protein